MLDFDDFLKFMNTDALHESVLKDMKEYLGNSTLDAEKIGWLITHTSERLVLGYLGTYNQWLKDQMDQ